MRVHAYNFFSVKQLFRSVSLCYKDLLLQQNRMWQKVERNLPMHAYSAKVEVANNSSELSVDFYYTLLTQVVMESS